MKIKKLTIIILFLTLAPIVAEAAVTVTVKPNVQFKLKEYNTFLQFEKETNFNKIIVENNKIQFDNYWFKLKGGNITFKNFFVNNNLIFNLDGPIESNSEIEVYSSSNPVKVKINGVEQQKDTTWTYDNINKIVKITYTL